MSKKRNVNPSENIFEQFGRMTLHQDEFMKTSNSIISAVVNKNRTELCLLLLISYLGSAQSSSAQAPQVATLIRCQSGYSLGAGSVSYSCVTTVGLPASVTFESVGGRGVVCTHEEPVGIEGIKECTCSLVVDVTGCSCAFDPIGRITQSDCAGRGVPTPIVDCPPILSFKVPFESPERVVCTRKYAATIAVKNFSETCEQAFAVATSDECTSEIRSINRIADCSILLGHTNCGAPSGETSCCYPN